MEYDDDMMGESNFENLEKDEVRVKGVVSGCRINRKMKKNCVN